MVSKIQSIDKELGEGNRFWQEKWNDLKWKLDYLKNQPSSIQHSNPFLKLFQLAKTQKPEEYIGILNEFNRKNRGEFLSPELKEEYEFFSIFFCNKV